MQKITMTSNNNGSQGLGEDNSNLSQDPPQAITITIMEPSSALGETLDKASISTTNLNSNLSSIVSSGSNAGTFFVMPSRGTVTNAGSSTIISEKEHVLQTSISKTPLEEEYPVISNISNPEEVLNEGQELTEEGEVYDDDIDSAASSGPHCLICNKELPQTPQQETPVPIFQVQTTTTQRKMSVLLGGLIGQKITSRKSHSDLVCSRCYNLLDKVDSLEVELQDTKNDIVNKYQTTFTVYGGRARRRKPATSKKTDFVFPKLEPDEPEREEVNLEFDSNFEPRDEDLLEEEADQQEDLIASGALDDEWEPEFKRSRLKRENTDTDPGVAPKRRRGRPRKDVTKPKETGGITLSLLEEVESNEELLQEGGYLCDICSTSFPTNLQLLKHKEEHVAQCLLQYSVILQDRGLEEPLIFPSISTSSQVRRGRPKKTPECDICEITVMFRNMIDLNKHITLKHPEKLILMCQLCNMRFLYSKQLNLHILDHFHGSFECEFCNLHFGNKYPLLKHMEASHSGDFLLKCEFCEFTTGSFNEYRNHRKEPHIGVDSNCAECNELVPDDEKDEHEDEHLSLKEPKALKFGTAMKVIGPKNDSKFRKRKKNNTTCIYCEISFSSAAALSRHNQSKHPQKYPYVCNTCSLRFKGSKALHQHKDGHVDGTFLCPICKLKFKLHEHVKLHFNNSHPDIKEIECDMCNQQFSTYSTYMYHCRSVHSSNFKESKSIECSFCGEKLANQVMLKKHINQNHASGNYLKQECPICQKNVVHLQVHMNLHTHAIQYPCDLCGEVFFAKSSLIAHNKLRHHINNQKHSCETCGKYFISQSLLRNHINQVHLCKRPFSCEFCSRSYKNKSALFYHLKIHTGDRPYKCLVCESAFHRPSSLKTHMKGTHRLPYSYRYRIANRNNKSVKMETYEDDPLASSIDDGIEDVTLEEAQVNMEEMNMVEEIDVVEGIGIVDGIEIVDNMTVVESVGSLEEVDMVGKINIVSETDDQVLRGTGVRTEITNVVENLQELYQNSSEENVYIIQVMDKN